MHKYGNKQKKEIFMAERRDVIRTKKALITATYELIQEPHTKTITVNDILERANISRGTFYAHYKNIPDLIDAVEDYILDQFNELFDHLTAIPKDKIETRQAIVQLINIIESRQSDLKSIFNYVDDVRLQHKIKIRFTYKIAKSLSETANVHDPEFLSVCICSIVFNPIIKWFDHPGDVTKEHLADNITRFIFDGYKSFFN